MFVLLHAFFMIIAWCYAAPFGALVARYCKNLGRDWYLIHLWVMFGGVCVFTVVGFGFIVAAVEGIQGGGPHHVCALWLNL